MFMHEKEKRNEKSGGSHFPTRYDGAGVMEQIYSTSPLSSSHQKEGKKEGEGVGFLSMASVPVCLARSGMVLLEGAMEARGGGGGGEEEKEEERRKKKKKKRGGRMEDGDQGDTKSGRERSCPTTPLSSPSSPLSFSLV